MISKEIDKLSLALCGAQADFKAIPKTDNNPFFKSKYAGLPSVVEAAQPILTKWGLAVTQSPVFVAVDGVLTDGLCTILLHESGQFIESTMLMHLPKNDPQGQGSAITYARRYSYMAILGLVADEDDDANLAVVASHQGRAVVVPKDQTVGAVKRRAPTAAATGTTSSATAAQPPESPPEARVSAADAKRELVDHAISEGWSQPDAKAKAKEAWGDRGTGGLLRNELELVKMMIEKAP